MTINHDDYEAIVGLRHGTLEDWAFDEAKYICEQSKEIILFTSELIVYVAMANAMYGSEI